MYEGHPAVKYKFSCQSANSLQQQVLLWEKTII